LKNHPVQCFYGKQTKAYDIEKSVMEQDGDGFVKYDKIVSHNSNFDPKTASDKKPAEIKVPKAVTKKSTPKQSTAQVDDDSAEQQQSTPEDDTNIQLSSTVGAESKLF